MIHQGPDVDRMCPTVECTAFILAPDRCAACPAGPAVVAVDDPDPACLNCRFGLHPETSHDGCGCPCGWTIQNRRAAIIVEVRTVAPAGQPDASRCARAVR